MSRGGSCPHWGFRRHEREGAKERKASIKVTWRFLPVSQWSLITCSVRDSTMFSVWWESARVNVCVHVCISVCVVCTCMCEHVYECAGVCVCVRVYVYVKAHWLHQDSHHLEWGSQPALESPGVGCGLQGDTGARREEARGWWRAEATEHSAVTPAVRRRALCASTVC